jgi:hypothetical protein
VHGRSVAPDSSPAIGSLLSLQSQPLTFFSIVSLGSFCRTVRIRDRRLGVPYYIFLALILLYNIFIIFFQVGGRGWGWQVGIGPFSSAAVPVAVASVPSRYQPSFEPWHQMSPPLPRKST